MPSDYERIEQGDDPNCPTMCDCCRMRVGSVRSSIWHGNDKICKECFIEWYDGNRPTMGTDDSDKYNIGNWIRKKYGLDPIEEMMEGGLGI